MVNELLKERRKLLQTAIIFGVGCLGLAAFFLVGIFKNTDAFTLALNLVFILGFGVLSYSSYKKYSNQKNQL